ncbi:hypothetical protein [Hyphomonas sp.]|uniref:hypothetical protein n=1 Tax=Hyphomonas sp. TaxID=87 RepID=UPI0025C5411C|nr:hypothetical protein [Hyphomonas sp.]MBI1399425.1 hypothetical protein [Hyphomonas sp.]
MIRLFTAGVATFALSGMMIAAAETSVASTTGEAGGVVVARGGETFSLQAGDPLFDGDRIVTRSGASAEISGEACTRTIPELSSLVIADDFCTAVIASADTTILADAGAISEGTGTGALLPLLGVAGAGGAAAAAGGGGGDSGGSATSP